MTTYKNLLVIKMTISYILFPVTSNAKTFLFVNYVKLF